MFNKENWTGQELIAKIQLYSFLVGYFILMPYMGNLMRTPEGEEVPPENLALFRLICVFIAFYVILLLYLSEKVKNINSKKYGGKKLLKGRTDLGSGREEGHRRLIKRTFKYERVSEDLKQKAKDGEAEIERLNKEAEKKEKEGDNTEIKN